MSEFDFYRYKRLLAEATDEPKRLALIELLIKEKARDRLAAYTTRKTSDEAQHRISRLRHSAQHLRS
jgi:hypothetical protein